MNCFIKKILIFSKTGEKRTVTFKPGLNIITGNSKTGKSALIEIVDYCLASHTSNIPQGVILNFAYTFAIILELPNNYLVISRKVFAHGGLYKISVKLEFSKENIENLNLDYLEDIEPSLIKDGQAFIERILGLAVTNINDGNSSSDRKRKVGLRDMTSFFFQHQNLIANKHALFYRFDDQHKRDATINSFPVFAGWVDDEYYSLKRELEEKEKELRQLELNEKKLKQSASQIENEIKHYFANYYSLIGIPFNYNLSITSLLSLRNNLPNYTSKTLVSQDVQDRYNLLKSNRNLKSVQLSLLSKQIKELEETEQYANSFEIRLKTLQIKSSLIESNESEHHYNCPTCGKESDSLNNEMLKIKTAKEQLENELLSLNTYAVSYKKEIEEMEGEKRELRKEINLLGKQIDDIEKTYKKIEQEKNLIDLVIYAKAQLELRLDLILKEKKVPDESKDTIALKSEIQRLNQRLTVYNIYQFYKKAEVFLSDNMNKIGNKLDFEEQLKPIKFIFDLQLFKLKYNAPKIGEISINEMGSGANWLTCHLSTFLSLLHYLSIQESSKVPSFLFLDQPSQVYFPSKFGEGEFKDNDIRQVEKIYIAILDEIQEVKQAVGFEPQVIVTDHADNLDLGIYNFNDYVRKRWTPEADGALI